MFLEPSMTFPLAEKLPLDIKMSLDGPLSPPKAPVNAFYQATELDKTGDHKQAEKIYLELLNADFDNPILHAALGMCYASMERNGIGALLLRKAIENVDGMPDAFKRLGIATKSSKPEDLTNFYATKRAECLNALGTCYKHENNVPKAREYFIEAQAAIPLNADIQNNLGTLYINEGKPTNALEHLDLALSINPDHPQASWNKSLAHLELGDYQAGWDRYDAGFTALVRGERNYGTKPLPVWDGTPGKTIVVYGEQGIGDEIMFASCLPDLLKVSKQVVFDCHKKLHTLFADAWPEIDIYPTREDPNLTWPVDASGKPRYDFDARVAIGSLPRFFRPTLLSFPGSPYLRPNIAKEAEWAVKLSKLGPRPKIGINWIGGHKRTRVEVRSTSLQSLLPILQQDADFISLQYTDCQHEIAEFEKKNGIKIHYFPEASHSPHYADTAALVANLDLVITVCTSVVHLSGAMGVPCWVLTPSRPAWRYRLDLDYLPWYGKSVTLFRQQPDTTDWTPVIDEVAVNLDDLLIGANK
jgi:tetratricopeptide (TPR) repeat protein